MKKLYAAILAGLIGLIGGASNAFATGGLIDLSSVSVDTDMVATLGLTVITALAAIWGVRKVVKFVNRS